VFRVYFVSQTVQVEIRSGRVYKAPASHTAVLVIPFSAYAVLVGGANGDLHCLSSSTVAHINHSVNQPAVRVHGRLKDV